MRKTLDEYFDKFEEYPPLLMTMTYESKFYDEIMKKAIKRGSPLTDKEIGIYSDELHFDNVQVIEGGED